MSSQLYILRRVLLLIPLTIGITLLTFAIAHVVPADPVAALLGDRAAANPEIVRTFRAQWGIDRPLAEQYGRYVIGLLRGNLGASITSQRPVLVDLKQYLPATIELASAAMLLSIVVGIPLGIITGAHREGALDRLARIGTLIGSSAPIFWLALVALSTFYAHLGWFPSPGGRLDTGIVSPPTVTGLLTIDSILAGRWAVLWNALWHLALPAIALGAVQTAYIVRLTRSCVIDVMGLDYIRTARAKGVRERIVLYRHVLRNAIIPTLSFIGLAYGGLLAGTIVVETVFSWPGVGRYALQSSTTLDFPAIMGVTLVVAIVYVLINMVVDILQAIIDPRIRVG
jgi:peptide/nickel transport system permease protein